MTTYKTYYGTHRGEFLGVAPTGREIQFETVDVMRVRNGKIAEHWGVANLFSSCSSSALSPPGKTLLKARAKLLPPPLHFTLRPERNIT